MPQSATAQTFTSLSDIARVTVLPGWRTETGRHMAGLRIELADGWKTYWRTPGETGIPPSLSWEGSENLAKARLLWPAPITFETSGFRSIGYQGVTVIPVEITPDRAGPITLRGRMEFGICEEICIPMSVPLEAELPAGGRPDPEIRAGLSRQARPPAEAGITTVRCVIEPTADGLRLTARIALPRSEPVEAAVVELSDSSIWIATPETRRRGRTLTATTELVPPSGQPFLLERSDIRITLIGGGKAVDIRGCPAG